MIGSSGKHHRLAAVAITTLVLAGLAMIAIAPHLEASRMADAASASRTKLNAMNRLAARGPQLAERNATIRSEQNRLKLLLSGGTTGVAGAELQRFLLKRTARHRGMATTVLIQPPENEDGLTRISALLTVRIEIKGLRDLLHDLETGLPLLFVSEMSVRSPTPTARGNSGAALDVRMRVSGYLPHREVPQS